MSFFHVLPSNAAPDTFPKNHASNYSTPIDNNYYLNGKWEVALMNMTYSGCINTFNNDQMIIQKPFNLQEALQYSNKPLRFIPSSTKTREDIVNEINTTFKGIVRADLTKDGKVCRWVFEKTIVHIVFSESMKKRFGLFDDVLAPWDTHLRNYFDFEEDKNEETTENYIILVPLSHEHKKITIKPPNTMMSVQDFIKVFNEKTANVLSINMQQHRETRVEMHKLKNDNILAVLSKHLKYMVRFYQSGLYGKGDMRYLSVRWDNAFKPSWEVYLYHLNDIQNIGKKMLGPITLNPCSFKQEKDVVNYLNDVVKDNNITFTLIDNNTLRMKMDSDTATITFSDSLRDILAFDQNTYSGKGIFFASDTLSLSRRIQYLYVYCNVNDYVRIGNTETPLLAVIPFNPKKCINLLQEKTFNLPMYVPVIQNPISQIDIAIYDGAGQLIPFVSDAVTSIRLHFRKV